MLTPSKTLEILEQLGHSPKKQLGQNFLIDSNIVRKSLEMSELRPDDVVVEVGPGLGTLTRAMLEAGAQLFAVEKDKKLSNYLKESIAPEFPETFHLREGDALDFPQGDLPGSLAAEGFKIIANLPYNISTPWLSLVLQGILPKILVLLLQKEAVDRLTAKPGGKNFGAISLFLNSAYEVLGTHKVSSNCFYPKPGVDSMLLALKIKDVPFRFKPQTQNVIRSFFTQRRKQLGHLIKNAEMTANWESWIKSRSQEADLFLELRPEALAIQDWQELDPFVEG